MRGPPSRRVFSSRRPRPLPSHLTAPPRPVRWPRGLPPHPSLARSVRSACPGAFCSPTSAPGEAATGASAVLAPAWAPLRARRVGLRDSASHHPVWSPAPRASLPTLHIFILLKASAAHPRARLQRGPRMARAGSAADPAACSGSRLSSRPSRAPAWSLLCPSHLICSPRPPPSPESRPDGPSPAPRCALPDCARQGQGAS